MKADALRNLRLVIATTLVSVWGYSHLAQTPVLGETLLPLICALLVAPGLPWAGSRALRFLLFAFVGFLVLVALLYWKGSDVALWAFTHSPWFVLPLWLLAMFGLVRNATAAERSAALARGAAAAAHAPDAG